MSRPVNVEKPTPYTFDLGNLLAEDPNPITCTTEESLQSIARDGAQALINQLLTTCPIASTSAGVLLTLPGPSTALPREKPVPADKPLTKWQQFAAKKGIKPSKKEGKMVYDEESGEWVPRWGYKGLNKKTEGQWLVEVNDDDDNEKDRGRKTKGKKSLKKGSTAAAADAAAANPRSQSRSERVERVKRAERKARANARLQRKAAVGGRR